MDFSAAAAVMLRLSATADPCHAHFPHRLCLLGWTSLFHCYLPSCSSSPGCAAPTLPCWPTCWRCVLCCLQHAVLSSVACPALCCACPALLAHMLEVRAVPLAVVHSAASCPVSAALRCAVGLCWWRMCWRSANLSCWFVCVVLLLWAPARPHQFGSASLALPTSRNSVSSACILSAW